MRHIIGNLAQAAVRGPDPTVPAHLAETSSATGATALSCVAPTTLEPPGDAVGPAGAVPQKCNIPPNPFSGNSTTSIQALWKEYTVGISGQPSIRQLELDHGDKWKYWDRKNEELVFDPDKDHVSGKITRLSTESVGFRKNPLKSRRQWQDSWYKFRCVINRLILYAEVLGVDMSEVDSGHAACRILEEEMAKSGKSNLKDFSETFLRSKETKALKKDKELHNRLKDILNDLNNVAATPP